MPAYTTATEWYNQDKNMELQTNTQLTYEKEASEATYDFNFTALYESTMKTETQDYSLLESVIKLTIERVQVVKKHQL